MPPVARAAKLFVTNLLLWIDLSRFCGDGDVVEEGEESFETSSVLVAAPGVDFE